MRTIFFYFTSFFIASPPLRFGCFGSLLVVWWSKCDDPPLAHTHLSFGCALLFRVIYDVQESPFARARYQSLEFFSVSYRQKKKWVFVACDRSVEEWKWLKFLQFLSRPIHNISVCPSCCSSPHLDARRMAFLFDILWVRIEKKKWDENLIPLSSQPAPTSNASVGHFGVLDAPQTGEITVFSWRRWNTTA